MVEVHPDQHGVVEPGVGEVGQLLGHGGAVQERLPVVGHLGEEVVDLLPEVHLEQPAVC